jgi:hypothetical protein
VSGTKVSNNVAMLFINSFNLSLFNCVFADNDPLSGGIRGVPPKREVPLE